MEWAKQFVFTTIIHDRSVIDQWQWPTVTLACDGLRCFNAIHVGLLCRLIQLLQRRLLRMFWTKPYPQRAVVGNVNYICYTCPKWISLSFQRDHKDRTKTYHQNCHLQFISCFRVALVARKCLLRTHRFLLPSEAPKCGMLRFDAMDPSPSSSRSSTHLRPKRMATVANLGTDRSEVAMWAKHSGGLGITL